MATTLTEIGRLLKQIRDELRLTGGTSIIVSRSSGNHGSTDSLLATISQTLSSILSDLTNFSDANASSLDNIESDTETNRVSLNNIESDIDTIQLDTNLIKIDIAALLVDLLNFSTANASSLDNIESDTESNRVSLNNIEADTGTMNTSLDEIESVLEGEILTELESIDQNWNLGSVNNIALLATASQTLGNSTEDKQDDGITKLNDIDSVLDDIETAVDGLEALTTTGNAILTTIDVDTNAIRNSVDGQLNRRYWHITATEVTSVAGGTVVEFRWTAVSGSLLEEIRLEYLGVIGTNSVECFIEDASSGQVCQTIHPTESEMAGNVVKIPENHTVNTQVILKVAGLTDALRLVLKVTTVSASDTFQLSVTARSRKTVVPVFTSSASTATVTVTQIEEFVR